MSVVVVGSLNVDLVIGLERMPDPGETVLGHSLERHPGGKGLNQAVAAARLGAQVHMVGAVGSDDSGGWLRSIVASEGIGDIAIATQDGPSGTALIEVDATGMNRIVVVPGANDRVTAAQVTAAIESMDQVSVVLTQGEVPITAIEAALRAGRARGARTILNPAPVRDYPDSLLPLVDILVPNEHEAAQLSGMPVETAADADDAARYFMSKGVLYVVITRGGDGAVWCSADGNGHVPAFPVTPIDTVAAGDAFCGALAAALDSAVSFNDALRWASAAGALATTAAGAVPSLPMRDAVARLLA